MSLRECRCPAPNRKVKPGKQDWCERCGLWINPAWTPEGTIGAFYDRLQQARFPDNPEWFQKFRHEAEARERAGRETFGLQFLDRNNADDGEEESSDGANYALFDLLRGIRLGWDDISDVHLSWAYHAAMMHHFAQLAKQKRRGAP